MPATVENVTAEANSHPIVVFICPTCPYCQKAVSELKNNGFDAKIIDAQPDQRKVSFCTSSSTNPNIEQSTNGLTSLGFERYDWSIKRPKLLGERTGTPRTTVHTPILFF